MRIGISRILGTAALLTASLFSLLPAGAQIKKDSLGNSNNPGNSIVLLPLTYHVYDLGTLGGSISDAYAINKYDVVVGKSEWSGAGTHAFFYDTAMNDLNNYLDASSTGWTLAEANGINDAGVIVGQGIINGAYHAFVAVPNPRYRYILLQ